MSKSDRELYDNPVKGAEREKVWAAIFSAAGKPASECCALFMPASLGVEN